MYSIERQDDNVMEQVFHTFPLIFNVCISNIRSSRPLDEAQKRSVGCYRKSVLQHYKTPQSNIASCA